MTKDGNILVLTQWSFKDALVQTYTLPYVDIIRKIVATDRKIFLVTAEQEQVALTSAELEKLNNQWSQKNMQVLAQPYRKFGLKKIFASISNLYRLYKVIRKEKIKTIHAFCTPAGSIAWMLSVLTGSHLIIDSYEPHAESMVETGTWKRSGIAFRLLFWLEKKQGVKAQHIIATTEGMKQYAKEKYGITRNDFYVKPACINFDHFFPVKKDEALAASLGLKNKLVCLYAGKLGGTYLRDEVFDFVKTCYDFWGDRFRFLMLSSEKDEEIERQAKRTGLPATVVVKKFVFHHEIPAYMSLGDFAINPQVPVPSKRFGAPIKNGEYWAMGLPVIISPAISDDSDIIRKNEIGVVTNLKESKNYKTAVESMDIILMQNTREALQQKIFSVAKKYRSFTIAEKIYSNIYGQKN